MLSGRAVNHCGRSNVSKGTSEESFGSSFGKGTLYSMSSLAGELAGSTESLPTVGEYVGEDVSDDCLANGVGGLFDRGLGDFGMV